MLQLRRPVLRILVFALCLCAAGAYGQSSADSEIERYSQEAQKALAENRYPDAERAFEKLRDLEPGVPEIYANLGLVYFQERKFEPAVSSLRHALKLNPALHKLDTLLAMSLSELGDYKEALPGLEKGFKSTDPAVKRMCGLQLERAYTWLHQDSKAVEVALDLDRQYPNDPEVLYNNSKILGNFAFLSVRRLAEVAPKSVWRHQAAAEAQESQGAYVKAIDEYQRVLEIDPNRPGIHYRLGRTLLARSKDASGSVEDRNEAAKEFQKELQLDSSNANAAYELGDIYRTAGQLNEAKDEFELALKSHPDFEEAHLGLASVLMLLNQAELALPHIQRAIALNHDNPVSWYRLARAERSLGHTAQSQKADAEFQRLRQKPSEHLAEPVLAPDEVTKQQIDSNAAQ